MDHECKAARNKGKNKRMEKLNGTPISKSCVCLHTITNAYTQTEIHMTKIIDVKQNDLFGVWYFQCLSLLKRPSTAYSKHLHSHNETLNCAFLKVSGRYTMKLGGLTACWRQSLLERDIEMTLCVCVCVCVCVCAKWGGHFPKGERATWIGKSPSDPHSALLPHFRLWACQNRSPHTVSSGTERDRLREK